MAIVSSTTVSDMKCACEQTETVKPPLGCMPKKIWLEARAYELSNAMANYTEAGYYDDCVTNWGIEFVEVMRQLQKLTNRGQNENRIQALESAFQNRKPDSDRARYY
ncbi:hypothetical protein KAR91_15040 [Candidatus Pacearchaeota archaeon]|nr:hypothetical protein [Candidatus Pacearchaeota archaeon]